MKIYSQAEIYSIMSTRQIWCLFKFSQLPIIDEYCKFNLRLAVSSVWNSWKLFISGLRTVTNSYRQVDKTLYDICLCLCYIDLFIKCKIRREYICVYASLAIIPLKLNNPLFYITAILFTMPFIFIRNFVLNFTVHREVPCIVGFSMYIFPVEFSTCDPTIATNCHCAGQESSLSSTALQGAGKHCDAIYALQLNEFSVQLNIK